VKNRARAVLAAASAIHFVHDGFSDILYVFLPLWASEFGLSLAQVGVIRTTYTGGMAIFQIPAGFLAERPAEESWPHYRGWRVNYERIAYALARKVDAVPALWSGRRDWPSEPMAPERPIDRRPDPAR